MKKIITTIVVLAIMVTALSVPVTAAASSNINPPTAYSTYTDYEDYVQSLLDEGLITQKGADSLLEEYTSYNNGTSNGGYWGGCWGRGYSVGYGRGGCPGGRYRR